MFEVARPALAAFDVPYLATIEHVDPREPSGFLPDGHYKEEIDARLGRLFLEVLRANTVRE